MVGDYISGSPLPCSLPTLSQLDLLRRRRVERAGVAAISFDFSSTAS
jgi:hypothetical protein